MLKRSGGFTLVELLIAVGIMVVLAGVGTLNIVTGLPKYRLKAAARDMASKLRLARRQAIKQNRNVEIVFQPADNTYLVDGRPFPLGQTLAGHYGSGVRFGGGKAVKSATVRAGDIPADAVSFTGNKVRFNARGISNFGLGQGYVYLTNTRGDAYAVGVRNLAGAIVVRRWVDGAWYPRN